MYNFKISGFIQPVGTRKKGWEKKISFQKVLSNFEGKGVSSKCIIGKCRMMMPVNYHHDHDHDHDHHYHHDDDDDDDHDDHDDHDHDDDDHDDRVGEAVQAFFLASFHYNLDPLVVLLWTLNVFFFGIFGFWPLAFPQVPMEIVAIVMLLDLQFYE